jgi:hypothetical protein
VTTFQYELSLNDREMMVVSEVFKRHIALCREANTPEACYHITKLEDFMQRLIDSGTMTSTKNFFDKDQRL